MFRVGLLLQPYLFALLGVLFFEELYLLLEVLPHHLYLMCELLFFLLDLDLQFLYSFQMLLQVLFLGSQFVYLFVKGDPSPLERVFSDLMNTLFLLFLAL